MTAQFSDVFRYRDADFDLAGISAGTLFDPAVLGLKPAGTCTACYRGYVATFALRDGRLVLDDLDVSLYDKTGRGKTGFEHALGTTINGIAPGGPTGDKYELFNNYYRGLDYHLEYTGGLLIADGFIRELYVHMGFHPAWKYRTVFELVFDHGRLRTATDKSAEVAAVRERATSDGPDCDIAGWIERCFDRSYGPK